MGYQLLHHTDTSSQQDSVLGDNDGKYVGEYSPFGIAKCRESMLAHCGLLKVSRRLSLQKKPSIWPF